MGNKNYLSASCGSVHKNNISMIRCNYKGKQIHRMIWAPVTGSRADPLTKINSSLIDALILMLFTGRLDLSLEKCVNI